MDIKSSMLKKIFGRDKTEDPRKRELNKKIQQQAGHIAGLVVRNKCTSRDVDALESLYKEYFKNWPDINGEVRANKRINQLRSII